MTINTGKKTGFTTGSCAAAAAKAAAIMLFEKTKIDSAAIVTPAGVVFDTVVEEVCMEGDRGCATAVSCAVRKHSGDDPDVTDNMLIYAKVSLRDEDKGRVIIEGGKGIGRVTRPGLDRQVGEAAINTVPRQMIEREVRAVMDEYDYSGSVDVVIFAPEGEEIAEKTFNSGLGIEGGISIIGTTGLVEPMSTRALIDTIAVQIRQKMALGEKILVVSPGNYGFHFMRDTYGFDLDRAVKCSNYIGEAIDLAKDAGFSEMLLVGHGGKLVKTAGGIMNTHSQVADCRMEIMASSVIHASDRVETAKKILDCVSVDDAYELMIKAGIERQCFSYIMDRIEYHLKKRAGNMRIECIVFSNSYGLMGKTSGADIMMRQVFTGSEN
ncbi:MAG: cobalamin biosynthesis protein CbiD [Lachnospiraceae bacterium]|nr:cobalamin biosynthesis protein CbiD [Lachnospiraceae bacterium]